MMVIKKLIHGILVIGILLFSACSSNDLSRDYAKAIIDSHFSYPKPEGIFLKMVEWELNVYDNFDMIIIGLSLDGQAIDISPASTLTTLQALKAAGFLEFTKVRENQTINARQYGYKNYTTYSIKYTQKTNDLILEKRNDGVLLKAFDFDSEITGIKFDNETKTSATVEYLLKKINLTDWAQFAVENNYVSQAMIDKAEKKIAKLSLYDDGWRVER